jgi:LPXTG-motif cell wall-anchored protein
MRRAGTVIAIVTALGLSMASPALAAPYPPAPTCHLSQTSIQAGGTIGISGFNWLPDSNVLLAFHSEPVVLGTPHTDADGAFSTSAQIPSGATAGSHTITGTGRDLNGQPTTVDCPLVVLGPAAAPGGVAFTGTNVSVGLVILGGLIVAGLGLLVAGRRRKAHAAR